MKRFKIGLIIAVLVSVGPYFGCQKEKYELNYKPAPLIVFSPDTLKADVTNSVTPLASAKITSEVGLKSVQVYVINGSDTVLLKEYSSFSDPFSFTYNDTVQFFANVTGVWVKATDVRNQVYKKKQVIKVTILSAPKITFDSDSIRINIGKNQKTPLNMSISTSYSLRHFKTVLIEGNTETLLEEKSYTDTTKSYATVYNSKTFLYRTSITGIRVEATDEKKQLVKRTLKLNIENLPFERPQIAFEDTSLALPLMGMPDTIYANITTETNLVSLRYYTIDNGVETQVAEYNGPFDSRFHHRARFKAQYSTSMTGMRIEAKDDQGTIGSKVLDVTVLPSDLLWWRNVRCWTLTDRSSRRFAFSSSDSTTYMLYSADVPSANGMDPSNSSRIDMFFGYGVSSAGVWLWNIYAPGYDEIATVVDRDACYAVAEGTSSSWTAAGFMYRNVYKTVNSNGKPSVKGDCDNRLWPVRNATLFRLMDPDANYSDKINFSLLTKEQLLAIPDSAKDEKGKLINKTYFKMNSGSTRIDIENARFFPTSGKSVYVLFKTASGKKGILKITNVDNNAYVSGSKRGRLTFDCKVEK